MASQNDLQDLIRLMTAAKVPIKDALARIKALQSSNLRSIQQIAEAPLDGVVSAIGDAKAARTLHNACKARLKQGSNPLKRPAPAPAAPSSSKRSKASDDAGFLDGPQPLPPAEYEASLELPVDTDEHKIRNTVLLTNRAPLVLAFAVELLRVTMPEQPPSSRLSLAQAVVSANSRSKAVSIGLQKGASADEEGWGQGQPKVRVLGREVTVLKRGGYEWRETPSDVKQPDSVASSITEPGDTTTAAITTTSVARPDSNRADRPDWSVSQPVTIKNSTFVVRVATLKNTAQRQSLLQSLFAAIPSLESATHNAWAYRLNTPTHLFGATTVKEDSFDDGESGCGSFLVKNMRELGAVDTIAVMTRWYGGVMLGPDRWRIMRDCLKDALAGRLRVTGEQATLGADALWGLDLEAMKDKSASADSASRSHEAGVVGMPIHRPEAARAYLLKSFATRVEGPSNQGGGAGDKATPKKKTAKSQELEKQENVSLLLGALRLTLDSWAKHLGPSELDRRAWTWYTSVRPEVESGPSGWGAKGNLKLSDILDLRREGD